MHFLINYFILAVIASQRVVYAQDNSSTSQPAAVDGFRLASRFTTTPLPALPLLVINQTAYIYGEQPSNRSITIYRQTTSDFSYPSLNPGWPRLRGHTAHVIGPDNILLCFGFNGDSYSDGLFEWRPTGNAMNQVATTPAANNSPSNRVGHASAWDSSRSRLWIWGGMGGNTMTALPELWMLDYANKTWSLMPALESRVLSASTSEADTLVGILGSSMVLIGSSLIICGGINDLYVSRSCVLFDTSTMTWWPTPRTNPEAMRIPARAYGSLIRTSENGAAFIGGFITVDDFQATGANHSIVNPWQVTVETSPRSINWRVSQLMSSNSSLLNNIAQDTLFGSQEDGSMVAFSPSMNNTPLISLNSSQTGLQLSSFIPSSRSTWANIRPTNSTGTPSPTSTSSSQMSDSGGKKDLMLVLNIGVTLCVVGLIVLGIFIYRRNYINSNSDQEDQVPDSPLTLKDDGTVKKDPFNFQSKNESDSTYEIPGIHVGNRPSMKRATRFMPNQRSPPDEDDEDNVPLFMVSKNNGQTKSPMTAAKPISLSTGNITPSTSFVAPPLPALTREKLEPGDDTWTFRPASTTSTDPVVLKTRKNSLIPTTTPRLSLSSSVRDPTSPSVGTVTLKVASDPSRQPEECSRASNSFIRNSFVDSKNDPMNIEVETASFLDEALNGSEIFGTGAPSLALSAIPSSSITRNSTTIASSRPAEQSHIQFLQNSFKGLSQESFLLDTSSNKNSRFEPSLLTSIPQSEASFKDESVNSFSLETQDQERPSSVVDAYADQDDDEGSEVEEIPIHHFQKQAQGLKNIDTNVEKKTSIIPRLMTSRSISEMLDLEPLGKQNNSQKQQPSAMSNASDDDPSSRPPIPFKSLPVGGTVKPILPFKTRTVLPKLHAAYSDDEIDREADNILPSATDDDDEVYIEDKEEQPTNSYTSPAKTKLLSLAMRPGGSSLVHFASSPLRNSIKLSPDSSAPEESSAALSNAEKSFKLSPPEELDLSFDFKF